VFEIGNTLREARVRRSLTLQQVEEDTKIRVKYIQAMENEEFDVMPAGTYVRGFLRTYSVYLGLDPDVILDEYRSRSGDQQPRDHEPFGGSSMLGKPHSHRRRNTLVLVAVLCVLALALFYVLGLNRAGENKSPGTQPSALGFSNTPTPTPSRSPSAIPSVAPTPTVSEVRVSAAKGPCWIEARIGGPTGAVTYAGTLPKGQTKVFHNKTLYMTLGDPRVLRMRVNGQKVPLGKSAGPVNVLIKGGKLTRAG
jgi:cytoskeleton protein RodZ